MEAEISDLLDRAFDVGEDDTFVCSVIDLMLTPSYVQEATPRVVINQLDNIKMVKVPWP